MQTSTDHGTVSDAFHDVYPVVDSDTQGMSSLRATIDLAPVGIAQFDMDGRLLLANPRLCSILGYSREELLALTFQQITFPDDLQACAAANAQLAAGEIPSYQLEKRFVQRDGTAVLTRVTVSAVRRRNGSVEFFVGIVEEISQQRANEDARKMERLLALEHSARERAERATRMRDDVLAVVAHDLRNPLHTIQLSASSMVEIDADPDTRARHAAIIEHVVERMDRLIGDLLDVTRIDSGSFPIKCADVDFSELLDETVSFFQPQVNEQGVVLIREDLSEPGRVTCDRNQLLRVLSNLVGNAVKFTPANGRVIVRSQRLDEALQISVEDTGSGIAPHELPYVFDRFWQSDRSAPLGVGLGLMIAKGIVESHGGRIWAESAVGRGSRFHFALPLTRP